MSILLLITMALAGVDGGRCRPDVAPPRARGELEGRIKRNTVWLAADHWYPLTLCVGVPGREGLFGLSARDRNPNPTAGPVKDALRAGKYPWYDADADRVRPVWPARLAWLKAVGKRVDAFFDRLRRFFDRFKWGRRSGRLIAGNWIGTLLLLAAIVAFFVCLLMIWVRREHGEFPREIAGVKLGTAARLSDLPEGIRPGDGDPWAEAQRRRAAGDLSGAIVCLFAHQLLTLDQLGLIRLAPGRTGRHYIRGLRDRELVDSLGATLRLFEDVYYGHRPPTVEAFEAVWDQARELQDRGRKQGAGASR